MQADTELIGEGEAAEKPCLCEGCVDGGLDRHPTGLTAGFSRRAMGVLGVLGVLFFSVEESTLKNPKEP